MSKEPCVKSLDSENYRYYFVSYDISLCLCLLQASFHTRSTFRTQSSFKNFKSAWAKRRTVTCKDFSHLRDIREKPRTHFLDLPEDVIRIIFTLLEDAEVYCKLRLVCRQLREYAEKYIQPGKYKYNVNPV